MSAVLLGAAEPATGHEDLASQIADATAALEEEPAAASLLLHRAELHRLKSDFELSRADYDRAETLNADPAELLLGRASLALAEGNAVAALDRLDGYLRLRPRDARAFQLRAQARLAHDNGDVQSAAEDLRLAIESTTHRPSPDFKPRRRHRFKHKDGLPTKRAVFCVTSVLTD